MAAEISCAHYWKKLALASVWSSMSALHLPHAEHCKIHEFFKRLKSNFICLNASAS